MGGRKLDLPRIVVRAARFYATSWPLWLLTILLVVTPILFFIAGAVFSFLLPAFYAMTTPLMVIWECANLYLALCIQAYTYSKMKGEATLEDAMADGMDLFLPVLLPTWITGASAIMAYSVIIFLCLILMMFLSLYSIPLLALAAGLAFLVAYCLARLSLYKQYAGIYEEGFLDCFKKSWKVFEGLDGFGGVALILLLQGSMAMTLPILLVFLSIASLMGSWVAYVAFGPLILATMTTIAVLYTYSQIVTTIMAASATEGYDPIRETFAAETGEGKPDEAVKTTGYESSTKAAAKAEPSLPSFVLSRAVSELYIGKASSHFMSMNPYVVDVSPLVVPNAMGFGGTKYVALVVEVNSGNAGQANERFRRYGFVDIDAAQSMPAMEGGFDFKGERCRAIVFVVESGSANHRRIRDAAASHQKQSAITWEALEAALSGVTGEDAGERFAQALARIIEGGP